MKRSTRLASTFFQIIGVATVISMLVAIAVALTLPRLLQVEDTPEKVDYIVPLAGNWHRYIRAAELYKQGYAPTILLSNSQLRTPGRYHKLREEMGIPLINPRELRRRLLAHLGVPDNAILSFGKGHISTVGEAEALRRFLASRPAKIMLVTSPFHTRRARMIFKDVMPGKSFLIASTPEGRITSRWWRDQASAQRAVSEGFKYVFYLLGGRFRTHDADDGNLIKQP